MSTGSFIVKTIEIIEGTIATGFYSGSIRKLALTAGVSLACIALTLPYHRAYAQEDWLQAAQSFD